MPDRPEHVRRVGARPPARLHQPLGREAFEQRVQREGRQIPRDEPGTELREHTGVEPGVVEIEAEGELPRHPVADRVRGLPVGQVLTELQHRDHHQLARRDPRPAPDPERAHEPLVVIHRAELVTDAHRQVPLRERGLRDLRGQRGDLGPGSRLQRHGCHHPDHRPTDLRPVRVSRTRATPAQLP